MSAFRYWPLGLAFAAFACAAQTASAPAGDALDKDGRLRVQITSLRQATLSAEVSAKIAALPFREGDSFQAGQTLVSFDCALYRAALTKAEAAADAASQTLRVNGRLAELESISKLDVELAQAKSRETAAEASAMRVTVSKCALTAPFSGRVAKLQVEPFQYVQQGKPLLDIVDTHKLELKLIVPSRWLAWVTRGTAFTVHVDDLNRDYKAHVVRTGARIDPVNQSVDLAGEIEGAPAELLPGMSGWATFKAPAK